MTELIQPAKPLPEKIVVSGQTWKLMSPGFYMTQHIGEITVPDTTTVFTILGSMNGLAVFLRTPWAHPMDHRISAMYELSTHDTLKELVGALLKSQEGD